MKARKKATTSTKPTDREIRAPNNDLLHLEFPVLREKSKDLVQRIDDLERNVVIACSAVFVFTLSTFNSEDKIERIVVHLIPTLIAWLGYYRYKGLAEYLVEVNLYAARLELRLAPHRGGWLTLFHLNTTNDRGAEYFAPFRRRVWKFIAVTITLVSFLLVALEFFRNE